MVTYIITGIVLIVCALAVYRYIRKLRSGDSCCATGEAPIKKVHVTDRNKSNYSYTIEISINGMTCANCAVRVENALNSLPDIWAQVDLGKKSAVVRSKSPLNGDIIRNAVRESGYIITEIKD